MTAGQVANDKVDEMGELAHVDPWLPHLRPVAEAAEERKSENVANLFGNLGNHIETVADYPRTRTAIDVAL